jgi:hypothetical protein
VGVGKSTIIGASTFWKVVGPSGLKVVGGRYDPWRWYRGADGEYIWTGGSGR